MGYSRIVMGEYWDEYKVVPVFDSYRISNSNNWDIWYIDSGVINQFMTGWAPHCKDILWNIMTTYDNCVFTHFTFGIYHIATIGNIKEPYNAISGYHFSGMCIGYDRI
jgi:hypothetical protein